MRTFFMCNMGECIYICICIWIFNFKFVLCAQRDATDIWNHISFSTSILLSQFSFFTSMAEFWVFCFLFHFKAIRYNENEGKNNEKAAKTKPQIGSRLWNHSILVHMPRKFHSPTRKSFKTISLNIVDMTANASTVL